MFFNIFDLLQRKNYQAVVTRCVDFAGSQNVEDLNQAFVQLFVDFLGRQFEITLDVLEAINNGEGLQELLIEIYESEQQTEKAEDMSETVKNFLCKFIFEAFEKGFLNSDHISTWINFLKAIAVHPEIPNRCVLKGNTLHLMSFLLNPLCSQASKTDSEVPTELTTAVKDSLNTLMEHIPAGFVYKTISVPIAKEFIYFMESCNQLSICGSSNYLFLYKKLLLQENNVLHTMALKSLKNLCYVDEVQPQLASFLFQQQDPEEQETFMDLLHELVGRKSLKLEVTALMKAMNNLPDQPELIDEIRQELHMNIFSGSRKLMAETLDLLKELGDDLWMQIIKLMDRDTSENIDVPSFLTMLLSIDKSLSDPKVLLKIVLEHFHAPEVSQRAAEILVELLKRDEEAKEMVLQILDSILEQCLVDEGTFALMLECVSIIDMEKMSEFFKANPKKLSSTILCMSSAFKKFNQLLTLFNIVDVMKKLTKLSPSYVLKEVRRIFDKYYLEFLDVYEEHKDDKPLSQRYKIPVTKLGILFENRSWNIMETNSMEMIYYLNQDLCTESEDPLFPLFVRFHTNYLKQLWARMVLNKSIPFHSKPIEEGILNFFSSIGEVLEAEEMSGKQNGFLLCSLLDMAVMFQPKMSERSSNEVFQKTKIVIEKRNVKTLASWVEKFVFGDKSKGFDEETAFLRKLVLLSWISFCKNYTALPSLTSSEIIIRHYRMKDPMKMYMDLLLKHLLTQKTIFEQTVAVATFNLANQNDMASFRSFHHSLEDFVLHYFDDATKRLSVMSAICSFILSKLKQHVDSLEDNNDEDRLAVFDYVSVFIKNMNSHMKQKLATFISPALDLNEVEKDHLEAFKAFLHQ